MASEEKPIPKPRRIGRWFLVGGIILLAGIYALRGVLITPHAIAFLERTVASNLGLQITIGDLGGTFFSDLEVTNVVTVRRLAEEPLADLQLRKLKLTYRLWDLFGGFQAFMAGTGIELEGARLSVDLTGETTAGHDQDVRESLILPAAIPRVNIQNSSVHIKTAGYETGFSGISLATDPADRGISRLHLQVAQWSLSHPALHDIAVGLDADMSYSTESLKIKKLLVDRQSLVESAVVGLRGLPDNIPFEMRLNPAGGQLNADGRVAADRLQVGLSGSGIDLGRISGLLAPPSVSPGPIGKTMRSRSWRMCKTMITT